MNPIILYDNRFLDGTPTATDTATGDYDVLNIRDLRPYTLHKFAAAGTKYYTVDCGSAKAADALAVMGHNLKTASATVSVESSDTGAWAGEETVRLSGFTPDDDYAFMKLFNSASARYWRIKIVTASIAAYCGIVVLGSRLAFPQPADAPYVPFREGIEGESSRGRKKGHVLGSVIMQKPLDIAVRFPYLLTSWITGTFRPAYDAHLSRLKPFFWAGDLGTFPGDVFLVTLDPSYKYETPLSVASVVDSLSLRMTGVREWT